MKERKNKENMCGISPLLIIVGKKVLARKRKVRKGERNHLSAKKF